MPHSIFLGSALATQDRISESSNKLMRMRSTSSVDSESTIVLSTRMRRSPFRHLWTRIVSVFHVDHLQEKLEPKSHAEHDNNSYTFVRAHIYHGTIDMILSLLGLAVVINSL
jgi:metal iron transporter